MNTVEAAWEILKTAPLGKLPLEEVFLEDALSRILGEDIFAPEDQPAWDTAAMDGFAVRTEDIEKTPICLKVSQVVFAGEYPEEGIGPGECAKIMTGAPLPKGADAVVPVEDTSGFGKEEVEIYRKPEPGSCVRKKGENIQKGELLLEKGERLTPKEIALLASFGISRVLVVSPPKIAVIATGDEVVPFERTPRLGQIRNSNTPMLKACLERLGTLPISLGVASDREGDLLEKVKQGLSYDGVVVTGGASVGERDCVEKVFKKLGVSILLHKVRIKPGKPVIFGVWEGKPVFGLPGNPVSAFVSFSLFVRPVILRLLGGHTHFEWHTLKLEMGVSPPKRESFLPAKADYLKRTVQLLPWKGSGDLVTLSQANCLARLPEREVAPLELIQVLPI